MLKVSKSWENFPLLCISLNTTHNTYTCCVCKLWVCVHHIVFFQFDCWTDPGITYLPKILWPNVVRPEARVYVQISVNVQISVGSSQSFFCFDFGFKAFVILTDPVPSTDFHNGNNNTQSIVDFGNKSHTPILLSVHLWSLYTCASKPFPQFLYKRTIKPHRKRWGILIVSDKESIHVENA